jgi:large subunit ribosomal protein L28
MARICQVCDKRPRVANNVSHANNKVKKWVYPNVHRMRYVYAKDASNRVHQGKVCTKCLKARLIEKIV